MQIAALRRDLTCCAIQFLSALLVGCLRERRFVMLLPNRYAQRIWQHLMMFLPAFVEGNECGAPLLLLVHERGQPSKQIGLGRIALQCGETFQLISC